MKHLKFMRFVIPIFCMLNIISYSIASDFEKKHIIVGGEFDYPPFSFLDKKGEPAGFSVELTQAIATTMKIDIKIILTMHDYAVKNHLTERLLLTEKPSDALLMLASGKGDYALVAQLPGLYWVKELNLSNIKTVGPPLEPLKNCYVVKKGNYLLLSRFTEGLFILNQTGEYRKLYEKWFGLPEQGDISLKYILKYFLGIIITFIFIGLILLLWSFSLRKQVAFRTKSLEIEIQERRLAEDKLLEQRERLSAIINATTANINVIDRQFNIIELNKTFAATFNLPKDELLGKNILELFPEEGRKQRKEWIESVLCSGNPKRVESQRGSSWVDVVLYPVFDAFGNVIEVALYAIDITDRKIAEEQIRQLNTELENRVKERTALLELTNKELESFSYSVSHDLRAPLRSIDGWSMALMEDYGSNLDEQGHKYIYRIRVEAQRMGQLIDDLLKLSRLTRTEMQTNLINLSELVYKTSYKLKEKNLNSEIEFIIHPDLKTKADEGMISIVLINLIDNAIKFSSKKQISKIEFGKLKSDDHQIRPEDIGKQIFYIKDNGVGFDMAYVGKLFGAFQRLHKTKDFPGTGIGLTIVQRIIHRHGGRIWAEGAVNQGATFYFTL
ncbi:MAG: transporter substrate-binding domain-containing protein [Desulfobacterales bacterium]|nr:transporter substrate-binding domain-containing protein [Desulfobacterales bacterium]